MATAKGYISKKLAKFHLVTDEEEVEAAMAEAGIAVDADYTDENAGAVNAVLVGIIPELLAVPDVSEDSFSIKRNPDSIRAFVNILCGKYGLYSPFPDDDLVSNASGLW